MALPEHLEQFPLEPGLELLPALDAVDEEPEAIEAELEKFVAANQSSAFKRYLVLSKQASAALAGSLQQDKVLRTGPGTFFKGVEADLDAFCVGRRK